MEASDSGREQLGLNDVLHAVSLIASEVASLRRIVIDEFGSVRNLFAALDRQVQGIDRDLQVVARRVIELGDDDA